MDQSSGPGNGVERVTARNLQTFREKWMALGSSIAAVLLPLGASHAQTIPVQYQSWIAIQ
jgi:hypothetical protein